MPGTWQVIKKERRKGRTEGRKDLIFFSILQQKLVRAVSVMMPYSRDEAKIALPELLYN